MVDKAKLEKLARALNLYDDILLCPYCKSSLDNNDYCAECDSVADWFAHDNREHERTIPADLQTPEGAARVRAALIARGFSVLVCSQHSGTTEVVISKAPITYPHQHSGDNWVLGDSHACVSNNEPETLLELEIAATIKAALKALKRDDWNEEVQTI